MRHYSLTSSALWAGLAGGVMTVVAMLTSEPGSWLDAGLVMGAAMCVLVGLIVAVDWSRNREAATFAQATPARSARLDEWFRQIGAGEEIRVGGRSPGQRMLAVAFAALCGLAGVRALPDPDALIGFGVAALMLPLVASLDRSKVDENGIRTLRRSVRWDDVLMVEPQRFEYRTFLSVRWVRLTTRDGPMAAPTSRSSHFDVTELCRRLQGGR